MEDYSVCLSPTLDLGLWLDLTWTGLDWRLGILDMGLTIFQHHLVSPPPSVAGLSVSGSLREIAPSPSPWRILYRINSYCSNASICKMFKDKWTYCLWKIGLSLFLYTASNTHPLNTPRIRFITKNAPRTTMETKYMNCHVQPCESWICNREKMVK